MPGRLKDTFKDCAECLFYSVFKRSLNDICSKLVLTRPPQRTMDSVISRWVFRTLTYQGKIKESRKALKKPLGGLDSLSGKLMFINMEANTITFIVSLTA